MRRLKAVAIALSVTLLSLCVTMFMYITTCSGQTSRLDHTGHGSSHPTDVVVHDRSQHVLPTYLQTDPQWSGTPYLNGTIGTHGCGLVCASMAYQYIFGDEMAPDEVVAEVGDTCSTDGVNDMLKFAEWLSSKADGGLGFVRAWLLEYVMDCIGDDVIVFCGMSGMLGETMYSSHVVLMHDLTEDGATVSDPYSIANNREFTWQELEDSGFLYYVIVKVT